MRSLLALLLCLLLPLQGLALTRAAEPPCPMQQAQMPDGGHEDAHDCCAEDDGDGNQATRHCKPGQECHAGSYTLPMRALAPLFLQPEARVLVAVFASRDQFRPDGVWRPPTRG